MSISNLPGFRDFYPDEMALRNHIFCTWREVAERYGFSEYDGPPLEPLELYTRKSGEEIVGQLYGFTDRGGREVALRPEMTPTLARMVSARAGGLPKPIKWFSLPQLFRYERPQKGRLREHFQFNLDIVGEGSVAADGEILAAAIDSLRAFGLDAGDFVARYSDRGLITALLVAMGVPEDGLERAFSALDKVDRESEDWVVERLVSVGAPQSAARDVLELTGASLEALEERFMDVEEVARAAGRLHELERQLTAAGLSAFIEFDARLVRGLAYYTGLVFELWDRKGSLRAICGGGRYDGLLQALGGPDLPAIGFGMGDVVLLELLRDRGLVPGTETTLDDYVIFVTPDELPEVLRIVHALRRAGRRVGFDYRGRGVGKQFRAADQAGAARSIVVGPDEVANGQVVVRDMETGDERRVPLQILLDGES